MIQKSKGNDGQMPIIHHFRGSHFIIHTSR